MLKTINGVVHGVARVYKYQFQIDDLVSISLPKDAVIMTVQMQHGVPTMWAMVDPDAPMETRKFRIYGTGHPVEVADVGRYISTFQQFNGQLVWHIFEAR
jgi:hypothetical protein